MMRLAYALLFAVVYVAALFLCRRYVESLFEGDER